MFNSAYTLLLFLSSTLLTILLVECFGLPLTFFIVFVLSIIVSELTFIIESHRYHLLSKQNLCESEFLNLFHSRLDKESHKQIVYRDLDFLNRIYTEAFRLKLHV